MIVVTLALAVLQPKPPPDLVLIQRVTVVDCSSPKPRPDKDVLIQGDKIVSVSKTRYPSGSAGARQRWDGRDVRVPGKTDYPSAPTGARVVDGKGKFLIPGLWDMHVHGSWIPSFAGIYLANGVTGIRDMFDLVGGALSMRDAVKSGKMLGPRVFAAGKPIDGPEPFWPGSWTATTAADGRQRVRDALAQGSDFIKVYSLLPRDAFFGVAAEAKAHHVDFEGHVPESVTALEASNAGMHSMEHLYGIQRECSPAFKEPVNVFTSKENSIKYNNLWLKTYDPKLAAKFFATLRKNHTYQTPTLTVLSWLYHPEDPRKEMQDRFAYMPQGFKQRFESGRLDRFAHWTAPDFKLEAAMFQRALQLVSAMNKAGVPILAGTDVMNPYCFPGFGLHDELHWLVKAGLTPFQALRAATLTPAEFFGIQQSLGTVQAGKIADCVLLDANPLRDIDNASKISAVVANGRYLDKAALASLMPKNPRVALKDSDASYGVGNDDGF